jgi:hypothetical protein
MSLWRYWFVLAIATHGCGQTADLGTDAAPHSDDPGSSESPGGSRGASGDFVFRAQDSVNSTRVLAIAGDHLYFPVERSDGLSFRTQLMRCEKANCTQTAQAIFETPDSIEKLQVFGDRIGMVEAGHSSAITTCELPDCTDVFKLDGLRHGASGCFFAADSIEWSQVNDEAVYRCAMPGCDGGPELLFAGIVAHQILRSDEVTILHAGRFVWRISGDASKPELLELGAESRTLGGLDAEASDDPGSAVGVVAIDGDWLYGSLHTGCTTESGFCTVARWPLRGYGPRELIFTGDRPIPDFTVYGGELAARTFRLDVAPWESSWISLCRTDDCPNTLQEIFAPGWMAALVSDDDRWYWAWNADDPSDMEIRSAPRLPVP